MGAADTRMGEEEKQEPVKSAQQLRNEEPVQYVLRGGRQSEVDAMVGYGVFDATVRLKADEIFRARGGALPEDIKGITLEAGVDPSDEDKAKIEEAVAKRVMILIPSGVPETDGTTIITRHDTSETILGRIVNGMFQKT